jgi:AcrR family transcriptional regulator
MVQRTYRVSQQTRESALDKAVELFNENGTAAISMNALADALGISAGNLQYHYRNKEALIRAIYELMFNEWEQIYVGISKSVDAESLRTILRKNFDLTWKYRFFFREYAALLHNDKQLAKRFREVQERRITEQEALIKLVAKANGTAGMINAKEIRNVVLIGWVLGNTWLSYVESTGREITRSALDGAVEILLLHYKPFIFQQEKLK